MVSIRLAQMSDFKNRRVLITGHTGFKGAWMSAVLIKAGAEVTGYALKPPTSPALFDIADLEKKMRSETGDIRELADLQRVFDEVKPEIVIHMAAQPLVRASYIDPVMTYETNVMGTVNLLECVRNTESVRTVVNVTTDKVYKNREWSWGYREIDELDGYDPYSNSKSCSDIITHGYRNSFFSGEGNRNVAISTARAGNVIGGGDFAKDRIIPDCVRAAMSGEDIIVRNPYSIRPYQHVLEPVCAYLMLAIEQYNDKSIEGEYNIGPEESDCISTGELVDKFISYWGEEIKRVDRSDNGPHEANYLKLDCSKIRSKLGWRPRWNVDEAIKRTVEWTKSYQKGMETAAECMERQIVEYLNDGI